MKIQNLMRKDLDVCTPEDSAAEAAHIMSWRNCGFVPVVENKKNRILKGVLTDRDLALFLGGAARPAREVQVKEFYTRCPITVSPEDNVHEAEALMEKFCIHRMPVVDEEDKLIGLVTLKDLAKEAWKQHAYDFPEVTEKEIAEIVEVISLSR